MEENMHSIGKFAQRMQLSNNKVADKSTLDKFKYSQPTAENQSKIQHSGSESEEQSSINPENFKTRDNFRMHNSSANNRSKVQTDSSNQKKEADMSNDIGDAERFKDLLRSQSMNKFSSKRPRCMIMPQDTAKVIWDNIILVAV